MDSMALLFYLVDCVGFVPVFHGMHKLGFDAGVQKVLSCIGNVRASLNLPAERFVCVNVGCSA